jgi:hypothetical protein
MSLTPLHAPRAARKKYTPEETRQINAHFLLTEFAADHEAELLLKVFRAHSFPEEAFDGDRACKVVACFLDGGASFHEALIELCFQLDFEGHYFHWRRNDLINYRPKLCPEKKTKQPEGSKQS